MGILLGELLGSGHPGSMEMLGRGLALLDCFE